MKSFFPNLKFVWKYAQDQKLTIIKFIILNVLTVIISVIAKIIIALTDSAFYQLIFIAIIIFIVEVSYNFITLFLNKCDQIICRETFVKIQTDLGSQILKLENKTIDSNNSGVFIQRLTNDTSRLSDVFGEVTFYLTDIITCFGVIMAVFIVNKFVFLYFLIILIILFMIEIIRVNTFNQNDKEFRRKNEKVSGFVGELVRGVRDIKMLNAENSFISELNKKVIALNNDRYEMSNVNRKYRFLGAAVKDLYHLSLICLLVFLITNNFLEVAGALIIYNYSNRFTNIATSVGRLLNVIKDFNLSASRIEDIISDKFSKEKFGPVHLDKVEGNFQFENVDFSYKKVKILKDLSFKISANETVAFVGKSGAGKTTIFNLLCKMYDVKKGKITIDGVNIKKLDKDSIRGNITIISQSPYIFNLSIRDNFKLVKEDLTEDEMIKACKMACLDDFINKLPDKYDTIIGEGGVNLSGGQKQRMAIARALIQKTEIILFDEATSALDNETQDKIQKAIENMKNEYTILIIAHRLSTIINADRILYLEDGKITAEGTHKELLKTCPSYKQLYETEINKENN